MASRLWRDGTRRGIAYVEDRSVAEQMLGAAGHRLRAAVDGVPEGAMAVYLDRRGRPFAWQISFDIGHWERVAALVGLG